MKIGILGSSFNPPHIAHMKISEYAIEIFNLEEVWWMITKHNPLKKMKEYLPFDERLEKINNGSIQLKDKILSSKKINFRSKK